VSTCRGSRITKWVKDDRRECTSAESGSALEPRPSSQRCTWSSRRSSLNATRGHQRSPWSPIRLSPAAFPSQFDDHTWVAAETDGTPAGCAACWTNAAGDPQVMESHVYVRRSWRRHGIGWRLARAVVDEALTEGRRTLLWSTYDAIPPGEAFSHRLGGNVGRVNRTSELALHDVDWELVQSWADEGPRRAAAYALEFWNGPLLAERRRTRSSSGTALCLTSSSTMRPASITS
jgi:GNAT superfamily N-acetyltransferase